jgi:hypothetical protein
VTAVALPAVSAGLAAGSWYVLVAATDDLGVAARTVGLAVLVIGIAVAVMVVAWAAAGLVRARWPQ